MKLANGYISTTPSATTTNKLQKRIAKCIFLSANFKGSRNPPLSAQVYLKIVLNNAT